MFGEELVVISSQITLSQRRTHFANHKQVQVQYACAETGTHRNFIIERIAHQRKSTKQVGLSRATLEFQVCIILSMIKISKLDPSVSKICCQKNWLHFDKVCINLTSPYLTCPDLTNPLLT